MTNVPLCICTDISVPTPCPTRLFSAKSLFLSLFQGDVGPNGNKGDRGLQGGAVSTVAMTTKSPWKQRDFLFHIVFTCCLFVCLQGAPGRQGERGGIGAPGTKVSIYITLRTVFSCSSFPLSVWFASCVQGPRGVKGEKGPDGQDGAKVT